MADAKTIQDNRTRAQKAKALHEQNAQRRADDIATVKGAYQQIKDTVALQDILAKLQSFIAYHQKIAQDGVGARPTGYKLQDGTAETETIYLTAEKRVNELERAAGQQEFLDYLERQLKVEAPAPNPDLTVHVTDSTK